jgi:hypothetical protein
MIRSLKPYIFIFSSHLVALRFSANVEFGIYSFMLTHRGSDEPKEGKQGVAKKTAEEGPYCLIRAKLGKQAISTMVANKVCS